jgi:hypothetical protein
MQKQTTTQLKTTVIYFSGPVIILQEQTYYYAYIIYRLLKWKLIIVNAMPTSERTNIFGHHLSLSQLLF